jgi:trans-aconitate 2-methyltransferase
MRYLFGDSDIAAHRLEIVHEVFAATSRPLLQEVVSPGIDLAIDLGCGPGVCTHFLAEVTGCARAVGLDSSQRFITLARARATARVEFQRHDVTAVPFPMGPADLLYCRLLLTHLHDPGGALARWATQLRPGGQLVIEEVEDIDTTQPVLRDYLDVLAALLAHQHNELYIGPALHELPDPEGLRRELSRVARLPVATFQAATMFLLNLQAWGTQDFVTAQFGAATVAALADGLRKLTVIEGGRTEIEWGMRQIVHRRV